MRMNSCLVLVALLAFLSGSKALNCTICKGDGASCEGNSKACGKVPQGQQAVCGRINYKVNGTNKVENRCGFKSFCVGSIVCDKDGFEFSNGKIGYSDCVMSCCETDNCEPKVPQKCYQCKGDGKVCSNNSVSCGTNDDRCLRVNLKVDGEAMVNERCYQSSKCGNDIATCNEIKNDYVNSTVTECKSLCCQGDHCNDDDDINGGSSIVFYAPFLFIIFALQI